MNPESILKINTFLNTLSEQQKHVLVMVLMDAVAEHETVSIDEVINQFGEHLKKLFT